jgi:hypothetical protein
MWTHAAGSEYASTMSNRYDDVLNGSMPDETELDSEDDEDILDPEGEPDNFDWIGEDDDC